MIRLRDPSSLNMPTISTLSSKSIVIRIGSPCPRPPGSLSQVSVKARPSDDIRMSLSVVCTSSEKSSASPSLNLADVRSMPWPFMPRIHPLVESTTVSGSFGIEASSAAPTSITGASSNPARRRPSSVLGSKTLRASFSSFLTLVHWRPSEPSMATISLRSSLRDSCSLRISISSSFRKARKRRLRIASAWVSVIPNRSIITSFG
mmetsp:Transcript_7527/g.9838  ORF Transcript_7527/g.9838 Transcript_7527/m.9838 type:complete len:205 (-) Transcript_7527:132-746(-)